MILTFAIVGFMILILAVAAFRYLWKSRASRRSSWAWRISRSVALVLSLALPVVSFFVSYPYPTNEGTARVLGFPFASVYFDAAGRCYVGMISWLSMFANGLVWSSAPWIVLAACAWIGARRQSGA